MEKKKENNKKRLVLIIGIIILVILLMLVFSKCSERDGSGSESLPETQEQTKDDNEENKLPENPSIGETVTGEEIQEEDGISVSTQDMEKEQPGLSSGDELLEESPNKTDSDSNDKTDSSNTNTGDTGDTNPDDEKPPVKQPTEEEESKDSVDEETEESNKYGNIY